MSINLNYANLEPHVQDKFAAVAAKDPDGGTAVEWFEHLVPESLQDSSHETEVFMDGGTVTQDVYVYDQGRASGHWETVEHTIDDRDISRIEAGANGGEYTHDNTIMEDSSINRSRGGEDMTSTEYEAAQSAETVDVQLIDGSTSAAGELSVGTSDIVAEMPAGTDLAGEALGFASEALVAGIAAYKVGSYVYDNCPSDWDQGEKTIATGGAAIGTAALAFTPPGQFVIACYIGFNIFKLGCKAIGQARKSIV